MSLKNILGIALALAMAAPALAQPTYTIKDAGVGSSGRKFEVYATPAANGNSLAVEFGIDFTAASNTSIVSATHGAAWVDNGINPIGNPGDNPFTGTVTEGIWTSGDQLFAALGSNLLTGQSLVMSFEISDPIGVMNLVGTSSLIAEDGTIYPASGTFSINGDFDKNGAVNTGDLGVFAGSFGMTGVGLPGDFDNNGSVNTGDLGVFAGNFGLNVANNALTASAVGAPEPTSFALLGLGCLAGISRRSRR